MAKKKKGKKNNGGANRTKSNNNKPSAAPPTTAAVIPPPKEPPVVDCCHVALDNMAAAAIESCNIFDNGISAIEDKREDPGPGNNAKESGNKSSKDKAEITKAEANNVADSPKTESCCSSKKKDANEIPVVKSPEKDAKTPQRSKIPPANSNPQTPSPRRSSASLSIHPSWNDWMPEDAGNAENPLAQSPEKDANKKQADQKEETATKKGSCCKSKKKDDAKSADIPVAKSPAPQSVPTPKGSCCASKKQRNGAPANTCKGCGDNCRCCIENGWSYCQCGPNCRCSNPLMAEQASLVLESTGQKPQPNHNSSNISLRMEDPLRSPAAPADLEAPKPPARPLSVDIVVGGMTCTMCSQAIARALEGMEGIQSVSVSLSTDVAHVEIDSNLESQYIKRVEEIQDMISDIGYIVVDVITPMPAKVADVGASDNDELSPMLESAQNSNTADHNENTQQDRWNRIAQIQEKKLQSKRLAFLWSLVGTLPILILTMILPHILPHSVRWWERQQVHLFHKAIPLESLLLWVLATPVQFICGWEFYKSSYYGIFRTGTLGMDVLVVLGTTASYGYAVYATLTDQMMESHFFETSAVLICFVLLGKWMQALAVHRTSDALTQLMQLQPSTAIRVMPIEGNTNTDWDPMKEAYSEEIVQTKQLQRGDIVKIVPGASLPADGVVLAGELAVDESMVTGESLPVLKTKSSVVLGGTVCVEGSNLDETALRPTDIEGQANGGAHAGQVAFCQVTGVGSSTALAQIIQLVQDAQASKVPMQNFADTVSSIFVPVVATLSIITFLVWYALCSTGVVPEAWYTSMNEDAATFSLMFGIACLVISCPCALGLATPTAVMVGTGMGAKLGILMKGGEALEAASQVNAVVLDKTGTVTTGKPAVTDFVLLTKASGGGCCSNKKDVPPQADGKPLSKETILWLLGSLERSSEHPLAKAIVTYAEEELSQKKKGLSYLEERPFLQPSEFRSMTGRGASGYMLADGNDDNRYFVAVGNRAFFASLDIELTVEIDNQMKELEEQGKTAIMAAINYRFCVILGVADELKPDAAATVAYLRNQMKIDVWMVTGDNARTAQAIARQLNLPPQQVVSEALPNAKVHQVKKLQQQGKIVAHVGDGINDSPALAQANVGISMGTGAAIAAEASDMVLVRGQHVADVCTALDLCRVIFARIQWNFLWSLVYNCLGIPLAAGVCFPLLHTRLPPTVAALAMALSSVSVVFSSLALRLYKPPVVGTATPRMAAARNVAAAAAAPGSTPSCHIGDIITPCAAAASSKKETFHSPGTNNRLLEEGTFFSGPAANNHKISAAVAASQIQGTTAPTPKPKRSNPQLVTSLSLDANPSSELAQPLLANQHLPADQATSSMEEGLTN